MEGTDKATEQWQDPNFEKFYGKWWTVLQRRSHSVNSRKRKTLTTENCFRQSPNKFNLNRRRRWRRLKQVGHLQNSCFNKFKL